MDRHFRSPVVKSYDFKEYEERIHLNQKENFAPVIISQSYREIKTKSLADDFYSNLIDWHNDKIYFAVEDSIFTHDFYTGKTTHLQTIFDSCITSIRGMGNKILLGTNSGHLHILDLIKEKCERFSYHKSRIGVIKVEHNNILTGSRDKKIKIIDSRSSKVNYTILQHSQEVCGMDISKNFRTLVTGGNDNKLFIFDHRNLEVPLKKCTQHKAAIKAISWSPINTNFFVTGGGTADKTVKLWDISLINNSIASPLVKSIDYGTQICNIKWLKNNQLLSTHGYSKDDIRMSNTTNFKCTRQFLGHKNRVIHFSLSADEKYFVTGSADCSIKFWEVYGEQNNEIKIR